MPTLAMYSPSKQRFATNVELYDEENASMYLKSVLSGSIITAPIGDVPGLGEKCLFESELKQPKKGKKTYNTKKKKHKSKKKKKHESRQRRRRKRYDVTSCNHAQFYLILARIHAL
ncbi:unnamed protein product [Peronospora destructor]|uniref:Uncharacterized protein n=1 Tax=Peronospora destructor TaxID=86335 RepID=A0AAV0SYX7_9STRA|nr:unnamed protein product [Peronospora destructor]